MSETVTLVNCPTHDLTLTLPCQTRRLLLALTLTRNCNPCYPTHNFVHSSVRVTSVTLAIAPLPNYPVYDLAATLII